MQILNAFPCLIPDPCEFCKSHFFHSNPCKFCNFLCLSLIPANSVTSTVLMPHPCKFRPFFISNPYDFFVSNPYHSFNFSLVRRKPLQILQILVLFDPRPLQILQSLLFFIPNPKIPSKVPVTFPRQEASYYERQAC